MDQAAEGSLSGPLGSGGKEDEGNEADSCSRFKDLGGELRACPMGGK